MCQFGASWNEWRIALNQMEKQTRLLAESADEWEELVAMQGEEELAQALGRVRQALVQAEGAWQAALEAVHAGLQREEDAVEIHEVHEHPHEHDHHHHHDHDHHHHHDHGHDHHDHHHHQHHHPHGGHGHHHGLK